MTGNLHYRTPTITASDPRGLKVRTVSYHRRRSEAPVQTRVNRQVHDAAGRLCASWDPRLWALQELEGNVVPNLRTHYNLASVPVRRQSVDSGWQLSLIGVAGQLLSVWDSRSSLFQRFYDSRLRLTDSSEQAPDVPERYVERLRYADAKADAGSNLRGHLLRHDDSAGSRTCGGYDLHGQPTVETRRFLNTLQIPDWPREEDDREIYLEPGSFSTVWVRNANAQTVSQTDASGNLQSRLFNLAGDIRAIWMTLAQTALAHSVVSSVTYDAYRHVISQTSGKGIVLNAEFDPANGWLLRRTARKPDHQLLLDLRYVYDAIGNVMKEEDRAQAVQFYRNQRIEPVTNYLYDSLYQLVEATGKESIFATGGPGLPDMAPIGDTSRQRNYQEQYDYDAAGNLLELRHQAENGNFRRRMKVAQRSNRSVSWADGGREPDPDAFFDANGNQQVLQPGQAMEWSLRNELRQVSQVVREDAANDSEVYQYDASGSRLRKSRITTSGSQGQVSATHYLPALELHTNTMTGERLQVIDVEAGVLDLRVLHWDSLPPQGLANDRFRYAVHNLLGSVSLELDENGRVISHEEYHPYGSTAWWASGSAVEASYKSVRYSGKIRDATGLYYYGLRFYAPWLMRWLSTDPALETDGLNLYQMVGSNPVSYRDSDGRNRDSVAQGNQIVPPDQRLAVAEAMIQRISAYEPALTQVLDNAAEELGAELYGREYRVKGAESLAQKLSVAPPDQMNDVLRYTIGFPFGAEGQISEQNQQAFLQGVVRTFHALGSQGYQPVLIRNTFFPDQSYRGINANFLLPDGKTKFEVQVHTAQSYKVKSEGHGRYEAIRTLERELAGGAIDESNRLTIASELEDRKAAHREASAVIATPVGIQEWVPSKPEMQGLKWQPRQLHPQQRAFYEQRVESARKQLGQSGQGRKAVKRRHSF